LHPWRSPIDLDLQYLDAIVLNLDPKAHKYGKNFLSFLVGVGQCNRPFGILNKCQDLSLDLSFDLSSMYVSRDLMV
jgi:hypothetical protein